MTRGFKGLRSLDMKSVLDEDRVATAMDAHLRVGAPPPSPLCRDATRLPHLKSLPPLAPLSARAMASVAALRGAKAISGATTSGRGSRSARDMAREATSPGRGRSGTGAPAGDREDGDQPSCEALHAALQDGDQPSCEALHAALQKLLQQVQSMGTRLVDNEQACAEKMKASQDLQKALDDEVAQAEVARLEVRNARQRLETFRSILGKASRHERPDAGSTARSQSTSASLQICRRRRAADDILLAQLSLAGAEGTRQMLLAQILKATHCNASLDVEISAYYEARGEKRPSMDEVRRRLAARRAENADMRSTVAQLRPARAPCAGSTNCGDSAAGAGACGGRYSLSGTSDFSAEDVEEISNADTFSEEQSFSLERDVALKIFVLQV